MQSWLEGRIWVGKGAQATGMTASLRILSSKTDSNTCESFTRSGLKLESVHQESPRSDIFRKRATKPLLNQRQHQKRLTWAVEKKNSVVQSPLFRWKYILHLIWKSRSQSLEEEWRGTESMLLEVQCEVSTVSDDLGCHVICWCWSTVFSESTVNAAIYQEILEHFHASFWDERHQTQQCRWAEGHCQRNLGFHTTSAVPQTDHLHATPNWGSN